MKLIPILVLLIAIISCKKSGSDNGGQGTGATVTFRNTNSYPLRLLITGTGADTAYPFPNKILDIDMGANSSVQRTNIPAGTRKLLTMTVCTANQPLNLICTTMVYKSITYVAGQTYTESF